MRAFRGARPILLGLSVLALLASSFPASGQAARHRREKPPHVTTGRALHVVGNSALLTGTVNPNGKETSYFFQYGLTTAYTSQTAPQALTGAGPNQRVSQFVSGLQALGLYHYRLVATNAAGTALGRDRLFAVKGRRLEFVVPKAVSVPYNSPFIFSGFLTGFGSPEHRIALQATPYPFLEGFASIGTPGVTDHLGRFAFRLGNLTSSAKLRLLTVDPLPVFSPIINLNVAVRVSFHVRSSGHSGLARLYGTVTPAVSGATVFFQVEQAIRPGLRSEATTKFATRFATPIKRGSRKFSRFSMVVKIRKSGRYRAFVKVRPGPLVSGASTNSVYLRAAPKGKK
jgi:hypothetical protein